MLETPPSFTQVQSLPLYSLDSTRQAGLSGYWAGYRPSRDASFGATVTLDEAWQDAGGLYLFLEETPTDLGTFLAALDAVLPDLSPTGAVRVLWLSNPQDVPSLWQLQLLQATANGSGSGIAWQVSRQAFFTLGGYAVAVQRGASLTQADPQTQGYGLAVEAASVSFIAPGGRYPAARDSAWLPLAGPNLGAWVATLQVPSGGAQVGPDELARLGVQLRYAVPAADDPGGASVTPVPMPIFWQRGDPLTLHLAFDPLNPWVPARTNLGFFAPDGTGTPVTLGAAFLTTRGFGTRVSPRVASAPLWNARLAFCFSPLSISEHPGEAFQDCYLAPDGTFELTSDGTESPGPIVERLAFGLSGLEYAGLLQRQGTLVLFRAGQPAFAPFAGGQVPADARGPLLTALATTSYLTFLPPAEGAPGLPYFAQSRQAPLFVVNPRPGARVLDFQELVAATLPSYAANLPPPRVLPVGVYARLEPALAEVARRLERAALAPARRSALVESPPVLRESLAPTLRQVVTPQGLRVKVALDLSQPSSPSAWSSLEIAHLKGPDQEQSVAFTRVGTAFQAALQSSDAFVVVSNVDTFMSSASVAYRLQKKDMPLLRAAGVPDTVVESLDQALAAMEPAYPVFTTESDFLATVQPIAGEHTGRILPLAGQLGIDLDGWKFELSPRSWRTDPESPTLMLAKYSARALEELVSDTGCWGWPEAARDAAGRIEPTQRALQRIIEAARKVAESGAADDPLAAFYQNVVRDPSWNGFLFLNAPVDVPELPQELQFLSAGIDTRRFLAHHVGLSQTPFTATSAGLASGQTAIFGLIDYDDPKDLYSNTTVPFGFKTLALTARFSNATLAGFSAKVELRVNRLFDAELTKRDPERGNNLVLAGSYQRQSGAPAYAFVLEGENIYDVARSALESVELLDVQLQTSTGTGSAGTVVTDFILSGNLRFADLARFDLFSFGEGPAPAEGAPFFDGYLRFGNLRVTLSFPLGTPAEQQFVADEGHLSLDLARSSARPSSLATNFPVTLTRLVASPNLAPPGEPPRGQRPEELGFTSISAPLDQALLEPPWYGLIYTLELGTLGALAGDVGLSVSLLAAWSTGKAEDERPVFLGLQLQGAEASSPSWSLQGVLRLAFRSFQFEVEELPEGKRAYLLRLRRLALSLLGWSFPPGNTDIYLFGNPGGSGRPVLGWYAAYASQARSENQNRSASRGSAPGLVAGRRYVSGRRRLPPRSGG